MRSLIILYFMLFFVSSCTFNIDSNNDNGEGKDNLEVSFQRPQPANGATNVFSDTTLQITLSFWDEFNVYAYFYIDTVSEMSSADTIELDIYENPINIRLNDYFVPEKTYYWQFKLVSYENDSYKNSEVYTFTTIKSPFDLQRDMLVELGLNPDTHRALWDGKYVYSLDLSSCGLTSLPEGFSVFSNLEFLSLRGNLLITLPDELTQITNLKALDLMNNQLEKLPANFGNLSNLSMCILSNNQLSELPKSIGHLKEVRNLELSYNNLQNLPVEIANMDRLQSVALNNNKFADFPIILADVDSLLSIRLNDNNLESIPQCAFPELVTINVERNNIRSVNITAPKLIDLFLTNNQLTQLTAELTNCKSLESLLCDHNKIVLVANLSEIKTLKVLSLRSNSLDCDALEELFNWSNYIPTVYTLGNATCWPGN